MKIQISDFHIGEGEPLAIIAGPCAVESESVMMETASELKRLADKYSFPLIFKSSYKKANRTSGDSFVTIGVEPALN